MNANPPALGDMSLQARQKLIEQLPVRRNTPITLSESLRTSSPARSADASPSSPNPSLDRLILFEHRHHDIDSCLTQRHHLIIQATRLHQVAAQLPTASLTQYWIAFIANHPHRIQRQPNILNQILYRLTPRAHPNKSFGNRIATPLRPPLRRSRHATETRRIRHQLSRRKKQSPQQPYPAAQNSAPAQSNSSAAEQPHTPDAPSAPDTSHTPPHADPP